MTGFDPRAGRPSFAWLNPESCISDARYQRPTDGNRSARLIAKIEQEFNWSKFAAVVVTDNGDGTYAVLDGQHRVAAALRHPKVFEIPALIMALQPDPDDPDTEPTIDTKTIANLSRSVAQLSRALRLDQDFENKIRERVTQEAREAAAAEGGRALAQKGLSAEEIRFWREDFLGVRKEDPDG